MVFIFQVRVIHSLGVRKWEKITKMRFIRGYKQIIALYININQPVTRCQLRELKDIMLIFLMHHHYPRALFQSSH